MTFPDNVYLAAFASAWISSTVALPLWRRWCLRVGLVDDPGHRKIHATSVPLAGGLAVLTGLIVPLAAAVLFLKFGESDAIQGAALSHGVKARGFQILAIATGAVGITLLGLWDDRHELRPLPKLTGQLIVALLVTVAGVRVTLFVPNVIFSYGITILWMLTVINAFNFMDNMNGLCTGLGAIGAGLFAMVAAAGGQYLVTLMALLICGALIGFLPHNFPNASAFLGDAGSHLVGYLLAVMAILPHFHTHESPRPWAVLSPLLILAVPLADLAWVVVWRWRTGRPFYVGDTNHLSHRLVQRGLSKTTAVLLIWLLAMVIGSLALL